MKETRAKAPEAGSKAAHNELVSKLEALNRDLLTLDKKFGDQLVSLQQRTNLGVAEAKAQSDAVRALFTGYALGARGQTNVRTMERVKEIVKESQEQTRDIVRASPPKPAAAAAPKSFKSPKRWDKIQQQIQQQVQQQPPIE